MCFPLYPFPLQCGMDWQMYQPCHWFYSIHFYIPFNNYFYRLWYVLNILVAGFPISSHPFSFPFCLVASACFILWFSGTLCRGIALTVPFENSKQHPGIFHFTEIDYFQQNTLWITLISLLMPYFIGPIYIFFSIFTMEWDGYFLDYIFAKKQGIYIVNSSWHILKWWSETPQICSWMLEWCISSK